MENNQENFAKQTNSQKSGIVGKFFLVVVAIIIVVLLGTQIAKSLLGGKSPQTPYAQEAYDSATYTQCNAHKALGNAKLADYFDGFRDASDDEVLRWKQAKEKNCTLMSDFQ